MRRRHISISDLSMESEFALISSKRCRRMGLTKYQLGDAESPHFHRRRASPQPHLPSLAWTTGVTLSQFKSLFHVQFYTVPLFKILHHSGNRCKLFHRLCEVEYGVFRHLSSFLKVISRIFLKSIDTIF
jgi:hypothetical protein